MNFAKKNLPTICTGLFIASVFLLIDIASAYAQETRNWRRSVKRGGEMEFQWLNYDERTCRDRGYPRLIINKAPKLGRYRTVKRKFTQRNGKCKGSELSVLLVYYVAGGKKGRDQTSYTIRGSGNIRINLNMRVY